jgi:hypothetical protein
MFPTRSAKKRIVISTTWRLTGLAAFVCVVLLLLAALAATAPKHPVAVIRVVDAADKPIAGAVIKPEGLRTKAGPYVAGWYGWRREANGVPNPPVTTDEDGYAQVPYPKYVFERIETGTLCLSVNRAGYVPDRPERVVDTALPAGAPWRVRIADLWNRIRHKALMTRPDPIVLQKGAVLSISVVSDHSLPTNAQVFAQVSSEPYGVTNFWVRPEPQVIVTRQLAAGLHTARAVALDSEGSVWFSRVTPITAVTGQTNELVLALKRGITIHGQLDDTVRRPVRNGRVVAHVTPQGAKLQDSPPQWHAWASVQPDGSFVIGSLPEGDLEITALCDGFVSTNGPGQFPMRYPQRHLLGTNDLEIIIGMEPTARLEVTVTDDLGKPLKDVRVVTWPNVRYGEWSATILMSDCYNTSELLLSKLDRKNLWAGRISDFEGVSDGAGVAVLPNLPANVTELTTEHPEFELPAVGTAAGQKRREASFTLSAGKTNHVLIQLEPRGQTKISHY